MNIPIVKGKTDYKGEVVTMIMADRVASGASKTGMISTLPARVTHSQAVAVQAIMLHSSSSSSTKTEQLQALFQTTKSKR